MDNRETIAQIAGSISLKAQIDALVETALKLYGEQFGEQRKNQLHQELTAAYVRHLQECLEGIENKNPGLAAALQQMIDDSKPKIS